MVLQKIKTEEYSFRDYISDSNETFKEGPYGKLLYRLKDYTVPCDISSNALMDIPSIYGTRIEINSIVTCGSNIKGLRTKLYYLENTNEEDLSEIRKIITECGGLIKRIRN